MDKTNKISLKKVILYVFVHLLLIVSVLVRSQLFRQWVLVVVDIFLYAPSLSPHDTTTMFVNCDMAGVYKTTNMAAINGN
ncbi:MAG: hypothetical protein IPO48_20140 [Saprospiraceae bacterium]|nr:hypothetical protein [Saprospiraceae bacterium]